MSDNERLKIIRETPHYFTCDVMGKDFLYLFRQAEQVPTLESYMSTLAKYGDDTRNKLLEIQKENRKLREALESIVDIDNHPQFKGLLLEHNDYLDQLTMIEETAKNALQ